MSKGILVSNLRQLFSVVTPEKAVLPLQQSVEPSTSAKRMEIYLAFAQNKRLIDSQADHSPLVQWAKRVSDGNTDLSEPVRIAL